MTPESRLAAAATANGRVGLIATPATVGSGAYARALAEAAPEAELHAVASAELAPLIQEGGEVDHRVVACVEGCLPAAQGGRRGHRDPRLHPLPARPARAPARARAAGSSIVSSGEAIADEVDAKLREAGPRAATRTGAAATSFLATGDPEEFRRLGTRFLQLPIGAVEHVEVAPAAARRAA